MNSSRPLLIGITGNIGSGKSVFCQFLQDMGQEVFYADKLAKEVLHEPQTVQKLIQRWGIVVAPDGRPLPEQISAKVFAQPAELAFLNSLVHPGTLRKMQLIADQSHGQAIIYEVPLLFEARLQDCFDYLVLITAPPDILIQRLQQRDKMDADTIQKRLASQIPDSQKAEQCDLVIINDGSLEELRATALRLVNRIPFLAYQDLRPFWTE